MTGPMIHIDPSSLRPILKHELKNYLSFDEPIDAQLQNFRTLRNKLETQSQPNALFAQRLAINTIFKEIVDELYKGEKELAQILRRRFFEKGTIREVAQEFHLGEATVSRRQEEGLDKIVDTFYDFEIKAREEWFHRLEAHLPSPPYSELIGVDETLDQLLQLIQDPNGPSILTLVGIGGIGKSSIADALTRRGLRTGSFQRPAWIYLERETIITFEEDASQSLQERLTSLLAQQLIPNAGPLSIDKQAERLRARLKMSPHLITINSSHQTPTSSPPPQVLLSGVHSGLLLSLA
ncbi:MAG: sigma factor-like helix-turn-helix DNA-binding protein, partial [Chloroflexota bacterium]